MVSFLLRQLLTHPDEASNQRGDAHDHVDGKCRHIRRMANAALRHLCGRISPHLVVQTPKPRNLTRPKPITLDTMRILDLPDNLIDEVLIMAGSWTMEGQQPRQVAAGTVYKAWRDLQWVNLIKVVRMLVYVHGAEEALIRASAHGASRGHGQMHPDGRDRGP